MFLCKWNISNFVYLPPMFVEGCCVLKPFLTARTVDDEIEVLPGVGQDAIKIGVMKGTYVIKIVIAPARPVYTPQISMHQNCKFQHKYNSTRRRCRASIGNL